MALTKIGKEGITGIDNSSDATAITITSAELVGIGTTSPSAQLHISGTDTSDQVIIENTDTGGGSAPDLVLFRNSSSPADNDVIGRIDFRGDDDNGTARDYVTLFSTITDASTATPAGSFAIQTRNGSSQTTRLIVDGSGNVGIGTSSPDTNLDIERSSNDTGGIKVQNTNNSQGSAVAQVEISGGDNAYANLLLECNSTNHSIRQDGSGNLKFINATTERMRIDGSGNVGINTSSPSTVLHVRGADATDTLTVGNTVENTQCTIRTHQDDRAVISATDGGTNRSLAFATGTTERARFDGATGNLMVGTSSSTYNLGRIVSDVNLASYHTAVFRNNTNNTGGLFLRLMNHAGQDCGSISQTGTTTSAFAGSSDYRLKENIKYDFDGTSKIKQIKPCEFNWIADGTDSTQEGFIAHELQDIVPSAVVGKKDEMETYIDDDGKEQTRPRYQGVDSSKIVPLLVKTIQELEARITTLEGA